MILCKNTLTKKKLTKKNPPINHRKRQKKQQQVGWKLTMAPSDASKETEVERRSCLTCSKWCSGKSRSFKPWQYTLALSIF